MELKCPQCGFKKTPEEIECKGCGHIGFGLLRLISEVTSQQIEVRIDTALGRKVLGRLGDEDVRFASEPQFVLSKSPELKAWAVCVDPTAKNPTFLDRAPLGPEAVALRNGSILSIGPEKLRMRVEVDTSA